MNTHSESIFNIYQDRRIANQLGIELIDFGILQYKRISFIKDFQEFDNSLQNKVFDNSFIEKFVSDKLVDSIRLTTCFENFLKTLLLVNGYVIHSFKEVDLKKIQKKRPVNIKDFLSQKELSYDTVGMYTLLSNSYKEVYKIDEKIFSISKPFFDYRNNVHLLFTEEAIFSKNFVDDVKYLNQFINNHMIRIQNKLCSMENYNHSKYLKEIKL
jgi:hypothetical protein